MIYPQINIDEWCRRNPGLKVVSERCKGCDIHRISTTRPFLEKDWVGLIAPMCDCGYESGLSVQVSRRNEFHEFVEQLSYHARESLDLKPNQSNNGESNDE